VTPFSRIPGLEEQQIESIYRRSRNGVKVPVQVCDSRHLEQTRRLEKWHSSNHPRSSSVDFISMQSMFTFIEIRHNSFLIYFTSNFIHRHSHLIEYNKHRIFHKINCKACFMHSLVYKLIFQYFFVYDATCIKNIFKNRNFA
jgi:hypothetical protein